MPTAFSRVVFPKEEKIICGKKIIVYGTNYNVCHREEGGNPDVAISMTIRWRTPWFVQFAAQAPDFNEIATSPHKGAPRNDILLLCC